MNWYIAKLIFYIDNSDKNSTPQFDKQLRLIAAYDEKEAYKKAKAIGNNEDDSSISDTEKKVKWKFINVVELNKLDELKDGVELHYQIEEVENTQQYFELANLRADAIETKLNQQYNKASFAE